MTDFLYETSEGAQRLRFELREQELTVEGERYQCDGKNVWLDGRRVPFWVHQEGDSVSVWLDGEVYSFTHKDPRHREEPGAPSASGAVSAQMPGKVLSLAVQVGESVSKGQNLLVMESMKMELALDAPLDGVVESVDVSVGQLVALGQRLVLLTPPVADGISPPGSTLPPKR
jgi:biotin carboxyl carrier protein